MSWFNDATINSALRAALQTSFVAFVPSEATVILATFGPPHHHEARRLVRSCAGLSLELLVAEISIARCFYTSARQHKGIWSCSLANIPSCWPATLLRYHCVLIARTAHIGPGRRCCKFQVHYQNCALIQDCSTAWRP